MKQVKNSFESSFFILITLITIIGGFSIVYLDYQKKEKIEAYYQKNIVVLDLAYHASVDKYNFFASSMKSYLLKSGELENLSRAIHAKEEDDKRFYKGLFYKNFYPMYKDMQQIGIRQVHFYLSDNTSFLRYHSPEKYGDDLTTYRPTVDYVNKTHQPISCFETGRVIAGFRNVFPIEYNNEYLGGVEISASLKSILDSMQTLLPKQEFHFILNAKFIDYKLFHSQEYLYSLSDISHDFMQEDSNSIVLDSPKELSTKAKEINKLLSQDKEIQEALKQNEAISKSIALADTSYNITFLPIFGIEKRLEGYLISYERADDITLIQQQEQWYAAGIIIAYILLLILLFVLRKRSKEISEQKNWFTDVNDSLGDGLYVTDTSANIVYINPMACQILGYTKEELLGKSAHYMFHAHHGNQNTPLSECPILCGVLEEGYMQSTNETFQTKEGKAVLVDINSRALYRDEEIYQIVSTFKDVTIQKNLENRMRLLTKALESSSNAIVITDKDAHVEWANPAFEKLTGFKLLDVLWKQPKEFVSSGKQSQSFYKDMWDTILAKRPWSGEIINKRKDGTLYYEDLSITPVLNAQKEIQNFIAIMQDITDRKEKEKNIEHLAYYDYLTNLPNRRLFSEHLAQIIRSRQRFTNHAALLLLDLDKFKQLNDTLGHDYGDMLLIEVSVRLERTIRAKDIVARLGGDEFAIILDHLPENEDEAKEICEGIVKKLLGTLREEFYLKDKIYGASASIGIALINNTENTIEGTLKKADVALYEAKARGRDTFCFYEE